MHAATVIQDPRKLIVELFDKHMQQPEAQPAAFDPSNEFATLFSDPKDRLLIPSLNDIGAEQIRKDSLVRFRCMVQDSVRQEMFVSAYEECDAETGAKTIQCHHYTDEPLLSSDDANNPASLAPQYLADRNVFYCISPPGESAWAKREYQENSALGTTGMMDRLNIQDKTASVTVVPKRYPIPGQEHAAALVKHCDDSSAIGPGQLVEFIGILEHNRVAIGDASDDELGPSLSTFSNVPVLHAITFRPLTGVDGSPFAKDELDNVAHQALDIRDQLIGYIATAFGGDRLVAEFVLLQLLAKTYKIRGFNDGHFALKITNFFSTPAEGSRPSPPSSSAASFLLNNPASKTVASVLENLVLQLVSVPFSLDVMNKVAFCPRSSDENLQAGVLQLGPGTTLLIDDTELTEGKLGDTGVRNLAALTDVIQRQTLTYNFPYSQFDFDVSIGVLILSSSKSKKPVKDELLPVPWTIRLEPEYTPEEADADNQSLPSRATLDIYRKYLQAARHGGYSIPEDTNEYVAQSFVAERKAASAKGGPLLSEEGLRLRLQLARLVALSFGESELTREMYDYASQLEEKRKQRFASSDTSSQINTVDNFKPLA